MSSAAEVIKRLSSQGVELWAEGDRLRYRAPGQSMDRSALDELRTHKQELLSLLRNLPESVFPASSGQQALWLKRQVDPNSAAYNVALAVRVLSGIDVIALRRALTALTVRHSSLRSTFKQQDDEIVQVVHRFLEPDLEEYDGSYWNDNELAFYIKDAYRRPFDLETGPLFRVDVFHCGLSEHVLLLTLHHIVCDAWSFWILMEDLRALYQQEALGVDVGPLAQTISFGEYVRQEQSMLASPVAERLLEFWEQEMAGVPAALSLSTDKVRPPALTSNGSSFGFTIDPSLADGLKKLARRAGATLYQVLLTGYQVLLHRYSGDTDFVIGSPVSGREDTRFSQCIGYFVNMVALRADLSGDPSLSDLLESVRQRILRAMQHQAYPLPVLLEKLNLERDPSRTPLFQTTFNLQQLQEGRGLAGALIPGSGPVDWGGLLLSHFDLPQQEGQFDLCLEWIDAAGTLSAAFKYNVDLFEGETVERMAGHYVRLLEAMVESPSARVSELRMLTAGEERELKEWNQTEREYGLEKCLHEYFEAQVERTPEGIALESEKGILSYRELNARANRLARELRQRGVGPETRVALFAERSLELMVGLYAVVKAGGAWVPLDPEYPRERLQHMLEDSGAELVLSQEHLLDRLPEGKTPVVLLEGDRAEHESGNLGRTAGPENLAYVIYTSGSTGKPKGAMNEHRGICNRLLWMQEEYGLDSSDVVMQKTPVSFDVSVWELFWPLWTGAKLVLAKPGGHREPSYLVKRIQETGVTTVHFVPSMLEMFVEEPGVGECKSLRRVIASGEALSVELQERFFGRLGCELHNLYGPTEAAVDVSYWACRKGAKRVPIGKPIANVRLEVLDGRGQRAGVGVAGELYIGGVGVGRGYQGRSGLTGERFVPGAWSGDVGGRLYRTGDQARWLADGNIEYLGRLDAQVKLRGFRIELGEIEAALLGQDGVKEAVVILRHDPPLEPCLVAYVTGDLNGSIPELSEQLRRRLPEYMVPSAIVLLERFPLNSNGKIDRKALPRPVLHDATTEKKKPGTWVEEVLAGIWQEVLHIEAPGTSDNFFQLGGHSLLVMQVLNRIRRTLDADLSVAQFFEAPTISGLAAAIETKSGSAETSFIPVTGRSGPEVLSFAQQRMFFVQQLEPRNPFYNVPLSCSIRGPLHVDALRASLNALLARHSVLRTRFTLQQGEPRQEIVSNVSLELPIVDLRHLGAVEAEAEATRLANYELHRVFDLATAPLVRATLFAIEDERHALVLVMHHIVSDGWTLGILSRELGEIYRELVAGTSVTLPALNTSYIDFSLWQRERFTSSFRDAHLAYWRKQLAGIPPILDLPTDHPRPSIQRYRGATVMFNVESQTALRLAALGRQHGATPFMTLLAGFAVLLSRYSGQHDIVIGTPVANRNQAETETLAGVFLNSLAIRVGLPDDPAFHTLLNRVRQTALEGWAHQELPFELLVDDLQPERSRSQTPIYQVLFVLLNTPTDLPVFDGLETTQFPLEGRTSKLDLNLTMREIDGGGIDAAFEYNVDLFEAGTVERIAGHYVRLLEAMVESPSVRVSELRMLTAGEERELKEWNQTEKEYGLEKCLHEHFEAQVERTPDGIALESEKGTLSYRELNARANRLARELRERGVGPETQVALFAERSLELMVGLYAVVKAGGAWVPLDPEYPRERLQHMLEDSGAELVLSQEHLLDRLPEGKTPVVLLEGDWAEHESGNLGRTAGPENLAYVIYTSGSTGKPKGAMNEHRGICNRLLWMQEEYGLDSGDVVMQKTPVSFDVSVWELFWPLWTGAKLVLAKPGGHREPSYLVARIQETGVTTVHFVPSMLEMFVEERGVGECKSLRRVIASGEALSVELQERFFGRLGCELHNLYGPTEAAVDVSYWACRKGTKRVPIGKPIANVRLEVLDGRGQRAGVGVAGELYIGGVGVGRGYQGRSGLTGERFVPDAWSGDVGGRLYRTGDQARWLADGNIEYLGRLDAQVKLRGFRIELGEIEVALLAQDGVKEAVVILRHDPPLEPRLVAYIVSSRNRTLDTNDLRQALEKKLPQYMIPTAFVMLDAMPLSPNGKLDRKALKAPSLETPEHLYIPPRNVTESTLAKIWADLLGAARVGIHDNFFSLGGDSIVSMQMVARARQAGFEIDVAALFEHQTVTELAAHAGIARSYTAEEETSDEPTPPIPIHQWFYERSLPEPHHFNQSAIFEIPAEIEPRLLKRALNILAERHEILRNGFSFEAVDLSAVEDLSTAIETHSSQLQTSLSPDNGQLCRAVLFQSGQSRTNRLLLIFHHLVIDGVSWRIFLEELETVSRQLSLGEAIHLPTPTASVKKWAAALWRYGNSETVAQEKSRWTEMLSGASTVLPRDRQGENVERDVVQISTRLTTEETNALLQLMSQGYRVRVNEVLLASLGVALSQWANTSSVIVDVEGHGREVLPEPIDVSRTIGWFTSIFPLRLSGGDPVTSLRQVKDLLHQLPKNGIGYGLLRYGNHDAGERLRDLPQAGVLFNYLGRFDDGNTWLRPAAESPGPLISPNAKRSHLLEINAFVAGGRLQINHRYSNRIHERITIEKFANGLLDTLRDLLKACRDGGPSFFRPDSEDTYALSPMQEGMLFETLLAPGKGVYWQQWVFTLHGQLCLGLFQKAWTIVIDRHPALRTAFHSEGIAKPVQVVAPETAMPWEERDWRHLDSGEQQTSLDRFLADDRLSGVNFASPPLMRATVLQLTTDRYWFLWSHHHLLLDGWSLGTVIKEVIASYQALLDGHACTLAPSVPYKDYIAWLSRQDYRAAEEFWRNYLKGLTPTASPFVGVAGTHDAVYQTQDLRLDEKTTAALQAVVRKNRVTASVLIQAAWALVLSRCSGQRDSVFGLVIATRPGEIRGVEEMVGLLINTIPVRVNIPAGEPASGWLRGLHAQQIDLERYGYCSLAEIQKWSEAASDGPLFDSVLVFENFPIDASLRAQTGSLRFEDVRIEERPHYPLLLVVAPGPELLIRFSYDSTRIEECIVKSLAASLGAVLDAMVANLDTAVENLPAIGDSDRQLLTAWSGTDCPDHLSSRSLHQHFEAQVERTPENIAVVYEGDHLTYRQLNERANQLAVHLQTQGVTADSLIGICCERSLEMVIAMLGVLKAGTAYVPLDPAYPAERLAFMIEDSDITVLLSQQSVMQRISKFQGTIIAVDGELFGHVGSTMTVTPDNLAYVIYTSGSTGKPKGVMQTHRAICNHMAWMQSVFPLDASGKVLQKTPFSFDASIWEFYAPLLTGGQLVMARPGVHQEPILMIRAIQEHGITTLQLVPSQLSLLLAEDGFSSCTSLHRVFCGGEVLTSELRQRFSAALPHAELVNLYGPTETCIDSTYWICREEPETNTLPIGFPVSNTQAWILNARQEPVPSGVRGELYLGGAGVARGYLGRPSLTAERFIPNPFELGTRLYRTGDVARWLPNGSIEYLGRTDHQVKLRGFRIELEEIEAELSRCEGIRQAAVLISNDRLIAYCATAVGSQIDTAIWIVQLQKKLPEYMVPGLFVQLDALPLTPNGKVDRRALVDIDVDTVIGEKHAIEPVNAFQELIRDAFSKVLQIDPSRIGIRSNFFELGGHSLLATQLVSRIRSTFSVDIRLRQFFEVPSVAALAEIVQARRAHGRAIPVIEPRDESEDTPLSFAQSRIWFLHQLGGTQTAYNMPSALRIEGPLDVSALEASFAELIQRHEALRTTFEIRNGEPVQVVNEASPFRIPVIAKERLTSDEQEREIQVLWEQEIQRVFDLKSGPLLFATLLRLNPEVHVLFLNWHHIISDGWSVSVFVHEFASLYDSFAAGRISPLTPLPLQYADFSTWQRRWLQGETLDGYLGYWKKQLSGAPALLDLPLDRPRPAIETYRGGRISLSLDPQLYAGLKVLGREMEATTFMTLLAGFGALLSRLTGQTDIVVGSPIANRNHGEIEGLIGVFVNNLALRVDLTGDPAFRELLRRVRLMALDAYTHQDLPFEQLVEELQPQRDLRHSPIFQTLFSLQTRQQDTPSRHGLKLDPLNLETGVAKYDLSLYVVETPEGIDAEFEYNADIFESATVERMAQQYTQLLASAISNPGLPISGLTLLDDGQREELLITWNQTQYEYDPEIGLIELFEKTAARRSDTVAISAGNEQVTYRELQSRVTALAKGLVKLGVKPETLVAVQMERCVEMLVATLAILKAGGAYLPLDPAYPAHRIDFMLQDSGATLVLTRDRVMEILSTTDASAAIEATPAHPSNLAYVIYTSGSTGKPKGVQVTRQNLTNFLLSMAKEPGLNEQDSLLAVTTLSFDIAGLELYLPLIAGAHIVLASREEAADGLRLLDLVRTSGATVMQATPTTWRILLEAGWKGDPPLRVLCGGEALPLDLARKLLSCDLSVWNLYGPTETTIWSSQHALHTEPLSGASVSIGRPIANTVMYVLDHDFQLQPAGVAGDLYIGGDGVARGYLGRSALTATSFVPDPFSTTDGARLYRTGDRARVLHDGRIECLGRIDHQTKLRGFRIELGEIESALAAHSEVREAATIIREDTPGDQRLVAYIVPRNGAVDESSLRVHVESMLPRYMVPSLFVTLPALPLTANGKIDRRALPTVHREEPTRVLVPPSTELEETIAGIWREVLNRQTIGIHENFFDVGGHSLLLVRVQLKLSEHLGREVHVIHLFEHPTIAALAHHLNQQSPDPQPLSSTVDSRALRRREALLRRKETRL